MKKNEAISILATSVRPREPKGRTRYDEAVKMAINALNEPERKRGKWIRGGAYPHHIFCSACYATYVPNDEWDIWKTDGMDCWRLPRKFCPNCGADMRGEQNG